MTSTDDGKAQMGLAVLDALSESELLQQSDQAFVDAVLQVVLEDPVGQIEATEDDGAEVVEVDSDDVD